MRSKRVGFALLGVWSVGCGGAMPPPEASPAPAVGTIRPVTQAQQAVAHYKTADGVYGLVLDRSGAKPKYRVDGQKDVVELTMVEDRSSGGLRGYYLVAPDGARPLYVTTDGSVLYEHASDELPLYSDAAAAPLPPATVSGTYVPPPPAYQALAERLGAISVRKRLPAFQPEDSSNVAKVGDAIGQVTADMFVHYASHADKDAAPREELVPQSFRGIQFGGVARQSDETWNPRAKGLARYGGRNEGFSRYDTPSGNHMQVMRLAGYPPQLAEGTPGIVWDVESIQAVFVTLDGARYVVDLSKGDQGATLDPGAGSPDGWPPPLQNALLDVHAVSSLVKAGALPQAAADPLLALDDDWNRCAAKVWSGAQRAIDSGQFTEADRKDMEKKVRARCAAPVVQQEVLLVRAVEARVKDRQALYDRAKAAVAQLTRAPAR